MKGDHSTFFLDPSTGVVNSWDDSGVGSGRIFGNNSISSSAEFLFDSRGGVGGRGICGGGDGDARACGGPMIEKLKGFC